jgi:hypothetical protein
LLNHITMTEDIFAWTKGITPDNESWGKWTAVTLNLLTEKNCNC